MRITLPIECRDPARLAALFKADLSPVGAPTGEILGVATHSDEIKQGDLFLCLEGAHTNGVTFVPQALRAGAMAILAPQGATLPEGSYYRLTCPSPEEGLFQAAAQHRKTAGARVIGVTGSAGKTTVKEAIGAVLGGVPCSEGNYNSTVGMPLSVLSFGKADHWVLELGINRVGEMRKMAAALSPDVAVITNVGSAHIGHFGDLATILQEKMELAYALGERGTLILPAELPAPPSRVPLCEVWRVGTGRDTDVRIADVVTVADGTRCTLDAAKRHIRDLYWPVPGRIGLSVLSLAGAVGVLEGRTDEEIREGLLRAGARTPRMRRVCVGDYLLLDDTYNASPESVVNALETLCLLAGERPAVAVLGDMYELGVYAPLLHDAVGACAARSSLFSLFTYGSHAAQIASGALRHGMPEECVHCYREEEREEMVRDICRQLPPRAVILFKASHGVALGDVAREVGRKL